MEKNKLAEYLEEHVWFSLDFCVLLIPTLYPSLRYISGLPYNIVGQGGDRSTNWFFRMFLNYGLMVIIMGVMTSALFCLEVCDSSSHSFPPFFSSKYSK